MNKIKLSVRINRPTNIFFEDAKPVEQSYAFLAAELGDTLFTLQAIQYDPDLLFG